VRLILVQASFRQRSVRLILVQASFRQRSVRLILVQASFRQRSVNESVTCLVVQVQRPAGAPKLEADDAAMGETRFHAYIIALKYLFWGNEYFGGPNIP
jgi:hypothetical protein